MDKKSTQEFNTQGTIIAKALSGEKMPKPSEASLAFIRNFARNFGVQKCDGGAVCDFVLN